VLRLLQSAGPTTAQKIVVSMGMTFIRELAAEIVRELPP
jgi:hypothetical protein